MFVLPKGLNKPLHLVWKLNSQNYDKETRIAFEDLGFLGRDAVQEVFFSYCLILKLKVPLTFKTSGTTHPMKPCNIPEPSATPL
jgi:hypothetical protein